MLSPTCWNLHTDANLCYHERVVTVRLLHSFWCCQQGIQDGLVALPHTGKSFDSPDILLDWMMREIISGLDEANDDSSVKSHQYVDLRSMFACGDFPSYNSRQSQHRPTARAWSHISRVCLSWTVWILNNPWMAPLPHPLLHAHVAHTHPEGHIAHCSEWIKVCQQQWLNPWVDKGNNGFEKFCL